MDLAMAKPPLLFISFCCFLNKIKNKRETDRLKRCKTTGVVIAHVRRKGYKTKTKHGVIKAFNQDFTSVIGALWHLPPLRAQITIL